MVEQSLYLPDTPGVGFEKRAYFVLENAGEARVCITTNVTLNENPVFGFVTTEDITATGTYVPRHYVIVMLPNAFYSTSVYVPFHAPRTSQELSEVAHFERVFTYKIVGHTPILTNQLPFLFLMKSLRTSPIIIFSLSNQA